MKSIEHKKDPIHNHHPLMMMLANEGESAQGRLSVLRMVKGGTLVVVMGEGLWIRERVCGYEREGGGSANELVPYSVCGCGCVCVCMRLCIHVSMRALVNELVPLLCVCVCVCLYMCVCVCVCLRVCVCGGACPPCNSSRVSVL